jgi:hypothetical protein
MQGFLTSAPAFTPALKKYLPDSEWNTAMEGYRLCKRCSRPFRVIHGNQKLCGDCRNGRPPGLRRGLVRTFGERRCDRCWRTYVALAENQRYCGPRCRGLARARDDAKYANPIHRGGRKRWAPAVATGLVRCARGSRCRRAELVDGELVAGLILPGERWHLGHPDGDSVGGPEHEACNSGAPSRLRARARRAR